MTRPAASPVPRIGGFTVETRIDGGGFADVFRGTDNVTRRQVALKVLREPLADAGARRRFDAEIRAMAMLDRHRNIARIIGVVETSDGRPCIVMDYYANGSLAHRLHEFGPLRARDVLAIGVQMCAALQSAHLHGVWHRDVKPANILIGAEGEPKLGDFGVAAVASTGGAGGLAGWSPAYVPPEVLLAAGEGGVINESQWDVYSLCATLYALLSGRTPYEEPGGANDSWALAQRVRYGTPQPLAVTGAPTALLDLLNRGVSREVARRPTSPEDLFLWLRAIEQQLPGVPLTEYRPFKPDRPLPVVQPEPATGTATPAIGSRPGSATTGPTTISPTTTSSTTTSPTGTGRPRGDRTGPTVAPTVAEASRIRAAVAPRNAEGDTDVLGSPISPTSIAEAELAARPRGRGRMVLIGVLVLGVLAAAGWGASRLPGGDQPGVTSTTPVTAASTPIGPTPQQVVRPLPVAAITASRTADGIRFTWTYDEPAAGDRFYVVRSDVENPKAVWPKESSITIVDDEACIEVTIYRANGQGGPAKRACYP